MRNRNAAKAPAAGDSAADAAGAGRQQLPTARFVRVATGNITETLDVTGALRANQTVELGSKISGRVDRVLVAEGERVSRGQLLIELDDADLRASVAQARAGLSAAQTRLRQTIVGVPAREQQVSTGIVQAQTNLQSAQSRYRQAQLNEAPRIQAAQSQVASARETVRTGNTRLAQSRETARQTSLQTDADIRRAESAVSGSRAALAEVIRGARAQQIASAQAQVNLAEANLRNAETELTRARILVEGGASPRASLDAAQTNQEVAKAQLDAARQTLSLTREGATTEQVRQAQEAVRQAEAGVSTARAGRSRVLVAQGEVTNALAALAQAQEGLRTSEANLATIPVTREETRVARDAVLQARAGVLQARANRSQIPIAREDVASARAGVETAQALLQQAQVSLNYARIYSPVNGVVDQKLTEAGQTAGQAGALLRLVSLERVYFEALVSENNIARVKRGQTARIFVSAFGNTALSGTVNDIIPTADARTRQFRVRISIPTAPRELTPGAFARAVLNTQVVSNALTLPDNAISRDEDTPRVTVAPGADSPVEVAVKTVKLGASANGRTQIVGGLQRGDRVLVSSEIFQTGDKVKLQDDAK